MRGPRATLALANLLPRLEFLAQGLVRRQRQCPHCGSRRLELLARKYWLIRVRRCGDCALAFTDPIYRPRAGDLYDRLYAGQGSTTELPDQARLEVLKRTIFSGSDKDFRARIEKLRELVSGPRLLELGSSWGYFLYQARAAGFDATGVEIGRRRAEFGRRELSVRIVGDLSELAGERFDLIYTSHVLEHFTDLGGLFPRLFELLLPGGRLAIEVPLFDFAGRGRAALPLVGAVHPLGFEARFFTNSLPPAGFRIVGFYERFEDVPDGLVARAAGDNLVCLAERPATGASG